LFIFYKIEKHFLQRELIQHDAFKKFMSYL